MSKRQKRYQYILLENIERGLMLIIRHLMLIIRHFCQPAKTSRDVKSKWGLHFDLNMVLRS